jgi:hypothetical protein
MMTVGNLVLSAGVVTEQHFARAELRDRSSATVLAAAHGYLAHTALPYPPTTRSSHCSINIPYQEKAAQAVSKLSIY